MKKGIVGFAAGIIARIMGRNDLRAMLIEFDWNSFLFIMGVLLGIAAWRCGRADGAYSPPDDLALN